MANKKNHVAYHKLCLMGTIVSNISCVMGGSVRGDQGIDRVLGRIGTHCRANQLLTQKSAGHICFARSKSHPAMEYYELHGEVYRAPLDSVFDVLTKVRIGRWECSRKLFNQYRDAILLGDEVF